MDLRHLELFLAVAEEEQFTRAARRCHLSQSALSTAIRSLERDLGQDLFLRTTRQVRLTEAGRALVGEARRTLAAAGAARAAVERVGAEMRGPLSIGGIPTGGVFDQGAALATFRRAHPGVDIRYTRSGSATLTEAVEAGRLDAAFATLPDVLPRGVEAIELATRRLVLVCRPDHPLAGAGPVDAAVLVGEDFVANPPGSLGYEVIRRVVTTGRSTLHVPFHVDDVPTMFEFVRSGLGVTLMYEGLASQHPGLAEVELVTDASWRLGLVTPSPDLVSPVARAFLDSVRAEAEVLVPG